MDKGYFSIIQFSPDIARCEAINIGIILFSEELDFFEIKTTENLTRAKSLIFPSSKIKSMEFLKTAKLSFCELVKRQKNELIKLPEFEKFVKTRAHEIRLTSPKSIRISDPEKELQELFSTMVIDLPKNMEKSDKIIFPELDRQLRMPNIANKIKFEYTINLPITDQTFTAPYAYLNGCTNFIKPQRIINFNSAERLAAQGEIIQKKKLGKLIVIPKVDMNETNATDRICDLFNIFEIQYYKIDQIDKLIQKIETEAHN